jgi:Flp pilus assembly pilin Flp
MAYRAGQGQSLVEYGLILALVAVVSIAGVGVLGNSIFSQLSNLATTIDHTSSASGGRNLISIPAEPILPGASLPDPIVAPGKTLPLPSIPMPTAPSTGQAASGGCGADAGAGGDGNGNNCIHGSTYF